jgi:glycosyltransferase involved in cell wall biosynthesis
MKVLLLSKHSRMGASSRLRSLQYIPGLSAAGIDVRVSSLFDERYLHTLYTTGRRPRLWSVFLYLKRLFVVLGSFRYDLVWIEKELLPYVPASIERLLRVCGVKYIVDYDDALFHNYDLSSSSLIRSLLGTKIDTVMRHSACVVAGNQYLAERARNAGARRIEIIPTVVDQSRYSCRVRAVEASPVVGWIGSPSTQIYVVGIREALKRVCEATGARLMLVGATADIKEQLSGIPVEVVPWSEASEAGLIQKMDVGIMPLEDGPWEKGKCGYKLIQYMACGVPVVASPVGVNVDIVNQTGCGLLADSVDSWADALLELLSSDSLQKSFGAAGRNAVEQRYSLQMQGPVLADVIKSVVRSSSS